MCTEASGGAKKRPLVDCQVEPESNPSQDVEIQPN